MKIAVEILLKTEVLDPAGQAAAHVLSQMNFPVESVRIGKHIVIDVNAESEAEAIKMGEEMAQRLLANPVMETFFVAVVES